MKKVEIYPRGFKGVWFPAEIWLNENLNLVEKAILVEIDSLDRHDEDGGDYCYASNEHLAKFVGCGVTKVSTTISHLVDLGYIEIVKTNGRKRWIKSNIRFCLSKNERQTFKNEKADIQNVKDSNTSIITTNKTRYNRSIPDRNTTPFSFDYVEKQIDLICDNTYDVEEIKNIFRYYYVNYFYKQKKHHPKLSTDNIAEIIDKMSELDYLDFATMRVLIDKHFRRNYGYKIDYNINHFMSEGIIDRLAMEYAL